MQPSRNLVSVGVEFAARVKFGHHHLGGGSFLLLMVVHRDAATVIDNGDRVIHVDGDLDRVAEPRQRFVYGVVNHLID